VECGQKLSRDLAAQTPLTGSRPIHSAKKAVAEGAAAAIPAAAALPAAAAAAAPAAAADEQLFPQNKKENAGKAFLDKEVVSDVKAAAAAAAAGKADPVSGEQLKVREQLAEEDAILEKKTKTTHERVEEAARAAKDKRLEGSAAAAKRDQRHKVKEAANL